MFIGIWRKRGFNVLIHRSSLFTLEELMYCARNTQVSQIAPQAL